MPVADFSATDNFDHAGLSKRSPVGDDLADTRISGRTHAVWHLSPGTRFVPYLLAGVGYASASLDDPIRGTVNGRPVSIDDDNGFTLNAGVGAKYFATDRLLLRLDARYRYLDGILDDFDDSLNTFETTLGVGWGF